MSLPIFVELLLQLLVGNVDQMMVSRVSQPSVAAIVNANQIMNLVIIVLSMASTAVTVILSQYLGAQDEKNASRTCMVSIVLIGGVSLAATILVFAEYAPEGNGRSHAAAGRSRRAARLSGGLFVPGRVKSDRNAQSTNA